MANVIINKYGKLTGWNDTVFNFGGTDLDAVTEFEYSDEVDWTNEYAGGGNPVGQGEGNYTAKGSFTVFLEDAIAMQRSLKKGQRIQSILSSAVVAYEVGGELLTDRVNNIRIRTNGRNVKQGDKTISVKFDFICTIEYDV